MQSLALLNQSVQENKHMPQHINLVTPGGVISGQLASAQFLQERIAGFQKRHKFWNIAAQNGELDRRRLQEFLDQAVPEGAGLQDTLLIYHPYLVTGAGHQALGTYMHIDLNSVSGWSYMQIGQRQHAVVEFLARLSRIEIYVALIIMLILLMMNWFVQLFDWFVHFRFMPFG